MKDAIGFYKEELSKEEAALKPLKEQMAALIEKKTLHEKNIQSLRWLISSKSVKNGAPPSPGQQRPLFPSEKNAKETYKLIILQRFADKVFKEADIRGIATNDGLLVRGKPISSSYGRNLFKQLLDGEVIERTSDQGTYKIKAQGA